MDTRFKRAVAAKCPIEMGRYDSLEQLQRLWKIGHARFDLDENEFTAFD